MQAAGTHTYEHALRQKHTDDTRAADALRRWAATRTLLVWMVMPRGKTRPAAASPVRTSIHRHTCERVQQWGLSLWARPPRGSACHPLLRCTKHALVLVRCMHTGCMHAPPAAGASHMRPACSLHLTHQQWQQHAPCLCNRQATMCDQPAATCNQPAAICNQQAESRQGLPCPAMAGHSSGCASIVQIQALSQVHARSSRHGTCVQLHVHEQVHVVCARMCV